MITVKDGQIIVTELRPMSEAPKPINQQRFSEYFLVFVDVDGKIKTYFTFTDSKNDLYGWFGVFDTATNFVGWLPLPIYQPEQKKDARTCSDCGASSPKEALKNCICNGDYLCDGINLF